MEKDKIFFADKGMTTTSANHVANLAKEYVMQLMEEVNSVKLYTSSIKVIGSNEAATLEEGIDTTTLKELKYKLLHIAEANSLIAWLREAIKAKDRLIKQARELDDEDIYTILGINTPSRPERAHVLTEDEYVATLSIKERNRYYHLQTLCSVVGKAIHPNGPIAEARKEFQKKLTHKSAMSGNGRDTIIYTYTPTVNNEDVETVFFDLQAEYRGYQAELNGIKHNAELAIQKSEQEADHDYELATKEYRNLMKEINAQVQTYKTKEVAKAQDLKITIPNSLESILEKVQSLGK